MSIDKSTEENDPFIEWVDEVEKDLGWTDYKWTTKAGLSASVLNNARNKGVTPKWDACLALAVAAKRSPITAFRKAGLLPAGDPEKASLEDWMYLINKLPPEEQEEVRQIIEMKIDRRQKNEQSARAKNFKDGKQKK